MTSPKRYVILHFGVNINTDMKHDTTCKLDPNCDQCGGKGTFITDDCDGDKGQCIYGTHEYFCSNCLCLCDDCIPEIGKPHPSGPIIRPDSELPPRRPGWYDGIEGLQPGWDADEPTIIYGLCLECRDGIYKDDYAGHEDGGPYGLCPECYARQERVRRDNQLRYDAYIASRQPKHDPTKKIDPRCEQCTGTGKAIMKCPCCPFYYERSSDRCTCPCRSCAYKLASEHVGSKVVSDLEMRTSLSVDEALEIGRRHKDQNHHFVKNFKLDPNAYRVTFLTGLYWSGHDPRFSRADRISDAKQVISG